MLLLSTISLVLFSTVITASPLDEYSQLEGRAGGKCAAELRKSKHVVPRGVGFELEERTLPKNAQCDVTGGIGGGFTPGYTVERVSFQRCADYCRCKLNHKKCQAFHWDEYPGMQGLGTCNIYQKSLKNMGYAPGSDKGPFYDRQCFKKTTPTWTPPSMTTTRHHHPGGPTTYPTPPVYTTPPVYPTPPAYTPWAKPVVKRDDESLAKRADTDEKFWALVLAEN